MNTTHLKQWIYLASISVLAIVYILPIAFLFSGSLQQDENQVLTAMGSIAGLYPKNIGIANYLDVLRRVPFTQYMFNSLFISSMVVISGLCVNSLAAYSLARLNWHGRSLVLKLILAIMILPLEAIVVPLFYQVTQFGWLDSYIVQIAPFIANAFSIYLFYTFFLGIPKEIEDGANAFRTFIFIITPNSKPVFASVAILTFLNQWSAFIWPLMTTHSETVRPLPLAISTFYGLPPLQWGDIFAFGVMMVTPVLAVFLLFQPWFIKGVAASAIKG